ncbi:MAG: TonB-dependent receptor, partial [Bacteroidetes bacterium]|nr:TonB-dependent receptor [Bacteroidota bacterium]
NVYGDETNSNMQSVATSVESAINSGVLGASGGALDLVSTFNNYLPQGATPAQIQAFENTYLPAIISNIPAQLQPQVTPYINQLLPYYIGLRSGLIPNQKVSRTGYAESQLLNNNTISFKLNGGLYYKLTPNTEMSLTANWGTGNTVYTGSDRYSLKDFKMGQYKFEIKSDKWFIRAYTTQERAGSSFNATITTQLFNEAWKPSTTWFPEYVGAYMQAVLQGAPQGLAYQDARAYADQGRPVPGTSQFTSLYNQVASKPIPQGGLLLDKSNLYHTEGQYNFSDIIKFAEVLVGASWRQYVLNSEGTIFSDSTGPKHTNEYGAYIQISKRLFDVLKLTASGRYDKNQNFDGKFTPRVSAVLTVAKDQNIRASYQNAYRFPSNQNQWINLNTGVGILIGGLPELRSFYHFDTNPVFNAITFQPQTFGKYKPEEVNAYELGYKGLFGKRLLIDFYMYYSRYKDFIGRVSVVQSTSGNPATINPADPSSYQGYSVSVNSPNKVSTYGAGLSIDYLMPRNFSITFNVSSDRIHNPDSTFATYWNTPKYRANVGFGNSGFGWEKRFGFNIQYRWQDSYFTEADFKQGPVSAFSTLDAMVSFKCTGIRSLIKLGATNLLNHYYVSQFGNPAIGGLYYVSFGYNVF